MVGLESAMDLAEVAKNVKKPEVADAERETERVLCKTESTQGRTANRCSI